MQELIDKAQDAYISNNTAEIPEMLNSNRNIKKREKIMPKKKPEDLEQKALSYRKLQI